MLFEPGDILFGKLRPYLKNWLRPAFSGIAVGDWWVLKPDLTTPEFLYAFIQGSPFQSIANVSTGTKMPRSDWNLVANAEFRIPSEQEEQALIGSFFRDLDDLITLHQRKYDKFVVLKKALLEKMFPRDGASVPEIRFAGFTDPWKQRKLGEVADIVFRTVEIEDDKEYQLVTVKRKNAGVVQRSVVKGRDILVKNYQELQTGDFLISKRQVVHGGNGLVPPSLSGAIVSNEYLVLVGNAKISSEFWALLSMTKTMCTCYFLSSFGVDIEKLVFDVDDWKKRQIAIPTQTEQSQICSFFRDLDDLITLHQRKLTLLRSLKAACLEKMFV
ncbi:restriction endonuclease subunit S [Gordonibacter urolithinfaciens]|uniref:restriction endonuclease subunit S n=1 Tax=Gordonibacter urolithinfaciens TaxID=1335613 RepID=UPI00192E45FB|nr:restriction endonuclease subunit S [Gordonibacter urolithinfaciens]